MNFFKRKEEQNKMANIDEMLKTLSEEDKAELKKRLMVSEQIEKAEEKVTDNYAVEKVYMTEYTSAENEWVTITFDLQDLLDNYDILDIVPLIVITVDNGYQEGDLYMTDFKFSK